MEQKKPVGKRMKATKVGGKKKIAPLLEQAEKQPEPSLEQVKNWQEQQRGKQ